MRRRDFVVGAVGVVGSAIPLLARSQDKPCPPSPLQVVDGSSTTADCGRGPAIETPAWLKGRAVNEWFEIPGTSLAEHDIGRGPVPAKIYCSGGPKGKINAWCGAALKRAGSLYLIGAAGGHDNYAGNEVQALTLGTDVPGWSTLRTWSDPAVMLNTGAIYKDYRKASTHTYYATQFNNKDNRLVLVCAGGMGASTSRDPSWANDPLWDEKYPETMVCSFSLDTNDWDWQEIQQTGNGFYPRHPGFSGAKADFTAALCCANPMTGDIIYARNYDNGFGYRFSRATNSWSVLPNKIWPTNYAAAAIDFQRNRMLVVGDYSGTVDPKVFDATTGATIGADFAGLGKDALRFGNNPAVGGYYPALVYDEANDRFLAFRNDNPIIAYAIDPATWHVSIVPVTGAVPRARENGLLNALQYVPELKGVVVVTSYAGNAHFMRVA